MTSKDLKMAIVFKWERLTILNGSNNEINFGGEKDRFDCTEIRNSWVSCIQKARILGFCEKEGYEFDYEEEEGIDFEDLEKLTLYSSYDFVINRLPHTQDSSSIAKSIRDIKKMRKLFTQEKLTPIMHLSEGNSCSFFVTFNEWMNAYNFKSNSNGFRIWESAPLITVNYNEATINENNVHLLKFCQDTVFFKPIKDFESILDKIFELKYLKQKVRVDLPSVPT
jgi:hypothetical protein